MFKKWTIEKLKNKSILKNSLVLKLKENTIKYIPRFIEISDEIIPKKTPLTIYNLKDHIKFYAIDNKPILIELNTGEIFPFLMVVINYPGLLKSIKIYDVTLEAILRGADLMTRGIFGADINLKKGEIVQIVLDETDIPCAIGQLMIDGSQILERIDGIGIKILHTLRDGLWDVKL